MGRVTRRALSLLVSSALALGHVTPVLAGDAEQAKALFDEARELAKSGKWPEACEKLEASKKLAPKMLTTYRLADCHERIGRTASAHAGFLTAAELAKSAGDATKQADALDRAKAIEGKLSRIVFDLPKDEGNLVIKLDGQPVSPSLLLEKLPLDPGEHALVATADGKQPHAMSFHVPPGPAVTTVTVPSLAPTDGSKEPAKTEVPTESKETKEPEPPPPVADTPPPSSTTKTAGFVALGVGVVGLGVGTWLGLSAKSLDRDAEALCPARGCTPEGKQMNEDARSRGNLATAVFAVGTVAAVAGVVLLVIAPSSATTKTATVQPWVGLGTGGLSLSGSF